MADINKIKTPQELMDWMNDNITYDLPDPNYDTGDKFLTKTAAEVIETGKGHCAEQSYLEKQILDNLGYKTLLVFVKENSSEYDFGYNGNSHVFLIFKNSGKFYWFEHAMEHARGIREYSSLVSLLDDVAKRWWRYVDPDDGIIADKLEFRFLDKPITGINNKDLAKECYKYPIKYVADISNNPLEKDMIKESYDRPYNAEEIKKNYGNELYNKLIKDPVHKWRMETGIELIHKEPSKKEFERIWNNWNLMSDKQKKQSDEKSIELFGVDNKTNYERLLPLYEKIVKKGHKSILILGNDLEKDNIDLSNINHTSIPIHRDYCGAINNDILNNIEQKYGDKISSQFEIIDGYFKVDNLNLTDKSDAEYEDEINNKSYTKYILNNLDDPDDAYGNRKYRKKYILKYFNQLPENKKQFWKILPHTYLKYKNTIIDGAYQMFLSAMETNITEKNYLDENYLDENNHQFIEKIVKKGNQWQVQSEKGRNMGTYDTKADAEKRLQQVHYFKYRNEDLEETVWYHGTTETDIKKFDRPINWFTTELNYAKSFGPVIYKCTLSPKKIFNAGNTDTGIYGPLPMKPYMFSSKFSSIAKLFNEKELRQNLDRLAAENGYDYGGYKMPIFTLVRSKYFANKLKELGYDAIYAVEFGNQCLGIIDTSVIKIHEDLHEDTRTALINKSRNQGNYKDTTHGKNRFERKRFSSVANAVKEYNQLDMNDFFKRDILTVKIPVQGETDKYVVSVKMEGVCKEIEKNVKSNNNKFEFKTVIQALTKIFNTGNVYVNCTCKDYLYNFDHWNIINNVSTSDTAHDPGPGKNIRNPNDDKGRGCKHVLLVLNNGDWLMKVASVINNYTHYAEEHMQKAFLKLIFPKIYGIPADEMVKQDIIDDEKYLDSSKGLIDAINAYGANRGKYKAGSNKNPVTGTGGRTKKVEEQPADEKEENK